MNTLTFILLLIIYALSLMLCWYIYNAKKQIRNIAELNKSISEKESRGRMLIHERNKHQDVAYKNLIRSDIDGNTIYSNHVILTNPEEVERFMRNIDGKDFNGVTIKATINDRDMAVAVDNLFTLIKHILPLN